MTVRKRFIYLLKHNVLIQSLYRVLIGFAFHVVSYFFRVDEKLVLFVSFMGKGFNDSPKAIYDGMKAHQQYQDFRCVWAFEKPEEYSDLETVKIDSFQYFLTAFRAKYWITNTNIERGLKFKKKGQVYLNTWHGIALKKVGNDCSGRNDFDFSTVDYLVVSGEHDETVWKSAFNANESTYLRCGMPRNDVLWKANESVRRNIREKLGLSLDKIVILYAPTWRDSTDGGRNYEIRPPIHFDVWRKVLGEKYIILFRAHHQTTMVFGIQFNEFVRDVSLYPDVNDLMIASDLLITDYSAIAFDYSILCKPILCYAYDYDTYLAERGTYFQIDERYPNKGCRTEEELLTKIVRLDVEAERKKTAKFRNEFIWYGNNATETCLKAVFGK